MLTNTKSLASTSLDKSYCKPGVLLRGLNWVLPPLAVRRLLYRAECPRESQHPAGCVVAPRKCWPTWLCVRIDQSRSAGGGQS